MEIRPQEKWEYEMEQEAAELTGEWWEVEPARASKGKID
jgi:hypothetical protein